MAVRLTDQNLLSISKAKKVLLTQWAFGVHLHTLSGRAIDDLKLTACRDRFVLAMRTLRTARWASTATPPRHRVVLARSYYAMYHAARVVSYWHSGGDDHEEHNVLPGHLPSNFPARATWENQLKSARLERNRADYDPYPKADGAFRSSAIENLKLASLFLPLAKAYLRREGCAL
jgi:hypothetical protein